MYRVFNMGIGMVIVVRAADLDAAMRALRRAGEAPVPVGNIQKAKRARVRLMN
jgi:phosphoribosylformylglycinamidine cyclo-ligase